MSHPLLALLPLLWLVLLPSPLRASWRVAETAHFRVHGDMPEQRLREQAALLEDFRALLDVVTTTTAAEGAPRLDVFLVNDLADTRPFDRLRTGIAGYYMVGQHGMAAFARADGSGQQTLLHEYAHHHMFATTGRRHPAWYVEGFAEFFSTATFDAQHVYFGQAPPRVGRLLVQGKADWSRLITTNSLDLRGVDAAIFYARAWALTHYLFRKDGMRERLQAYLTAIAAGQPGGDAFAAHVADPATLERTVRAYLGSKEFSFSRMDRQPVPASAIRVRPLSPAADAMLMMLVSLSTRGPAADDPAAALASVRAAAARFPGDALATRTLALAELHWGDKAAALALAEQALAAAPDDAELLRLKGQALLAADRQANRGAARRVLAEAIKRDPADWRAMRLYVHTHDLVGSLVPDSLFNIIETMWSLAPQVDANAIDMAVALIRRDRLSDAAQVLEPLAYAPHGTRPRIRALHAAALAGDRAAIARALAVPPP